MKTSRHLRIYAQALTVVVVFVVVVGVAHAQDAEAHYQQAIALFNEGQYQDALLSLDTAIALSPEESVFHCNRGAILLKLRDNAEALHALEVCLATYDGEESEMAQIDAEVQALRLVVRVIEPSALSVSVQSATAPTPPALSSDDDGISPVRVTAWAFAGLATVSLVAALIVDQQTLAQIDEFEEVAEEGNDRERYDTLNNSIDRRQLAVGTLTAVGGIALLSSAVLFWLSWDTNEATTSEDVRFMGPVGVSPVQSGAVLRWEGTF